MTDETKCNICCRTDGTKIRATVREIERATVRTTIKEKTTENSNETTKEIEKELTKEVTNEVKKERTKDVIRASKNNDRRNRKGKGFIMPIRVKNNLPAKKLLEDENIFVMDETRAMSQDIRPLKIAILNLMPLKEDTEYHLLRSLANSPLQVDVTFVRTASHLGKNTAFEHMEEFYVTYDEVKHHKFDGLIITGAPVENLEFEEVSYWEELKEIMEWSKTNVTSTYHICWGAQAGLYYHYGVRKLPLEKKLSGVYKHQVFNRREPLIRGFDDGFSAPHSRYTTSSKEDIEKNPNLTILSESDEAGVFIVISNDGKQVFVTGHPEYDRLTLDKEYRRDVAKGINPDVPENYYPGDDASQKPILSWRAHANTLYSNWLNYYVYQVTPYILE